MSNAPINQGRRRFLTASTMVVGGLGMAAVAVPFIQSFNPSAKAKANAAPIEVDVSKIDEGQLIRVEWQGKPVWVVRRPVAMISALSEHEDQLRDPTSTEGQQPSYAQNRYRSIRPDIFIAVGICTHLGCSPTYLPASFDAHIQGVSAGFFCPCHGSKFDMAGRVFRDVPAPLNLVVPKYRYLSETRIVIGIDMDEQA